MGAKPRVRIAFLGVGFALIPEEDNPQLLRRVDTRILLYDCSFCNALAGQLCRDKSGNVMTDGHYRGKGRGRHMPYEERLAMAAGLIAAGRFDRVEIVESRATLRTHEEE